MVFHGGVAPLIGTTISSWKVPPPLVSPWCPALTSGSSQLSASNSDPTQGNRFCWPAKPGEGSHWALALDETWVCLLLHVKTRLGRECRGNHSIDPIDKKVYMKTGLKGL